LPRITVAARPPKRKPTPFPKDKMWPDEVVHFSKVLADEERTEDEVVDALEDVQAMHEDEPHWVLPWPSYLADGKDDVYARGLIGLVRGILRCVDSSNDAVSVAGVRCLYCLCMEGTQMTNMPATLLVEAAGMSPLCRVMARRHSPDAMAILVHVARGVPHEMIPSLIKTGTIFAAADMLESRESVPSDQFVALEMLMVLCKKAPSLVADERVFMAVKQVSNPVLLGKRKKIMSILAPLIGPVEKTDDMEEAEASTNFLSMMRRSPR